MPIDPDIRFRTHTRLDGFDYREPHAYFITICVRGRACVLGSIENESVRLTRLGLIVQHGWNDIPNHRHHVELDAFIIMPNHIHGIVCIVGDVAGFSVEATPASRPTLATGARAGSLGAIVGSFETAVSRTINQLRPGAGDGLWQPNYHDHIIRNDRSIDSIREHIVSNPLRWTQDSENPAGDGKDDVEAFIRGLVAEVSPLRGERDVGVGPRAATDDARGGWR